MYLGIATNFGILNINWGFLSFAGCQNVGDGRGYLCYPLVTISWIASLQLAGQGEIYGSVVSDALQNVCLH